MRIFEIVPNVSCGGISFLSDRKTVRKTLGACTTFKKGITAKNTTDDFGFCHAFYDENDNLKALEFFPEADLRLGDNTLFAMASDSFVDLVKQIDNNADADEYYLVSKSLSIGAEFSGQGIKSILVGCEGYYDN
jgi:hypothetical protein